MNKFVVVLMCLFSFQAFGGENDEKVRQHVQDAMAHAKKHSSKGPRNSQDWVRLADTAAKLVAPAGKSKSARDEDEEDESDGIMGLLEEFFK